MTKSTKILLILTAVLIIIVAGVWWLVASQSNQNAETVSLQENAPAATPPAVQPQSQEPVQPAAPATTSSQAPAALSSGNSNGDITADLNSADVQMNSLNADIVNSSQTAPAPVSQ